MRAGIRSLMIAAFAAGATFTLSIRNAEALGPGACQAYADRAVAQSKRMRENKCGYNVSEGPTHEASGPAWSIDRNAYIRECRKFTSVDTPKERNRARELALGRCTECREYATEASNRGRENVKFSCGFSGPQWDINSQTQFNYCMANYSVTEDGPTFEGKYGGPYYKSNQKNREREEGMKECKDQFTPEQIALCHTYSEKAREQAVWNVEHKCGDAKAGAEVGRWTSNSDHHFAFCTAGFKRNEDAAIKASMKAEEEAREGRNAWCQPNLAMKKKNPRTHDPKSRYRGDRNPLAKPAEVTVPRDKPGSSSSAIDRLSNAPSGPASGGSYKSKDGGAPTQTRSSGGGAGTQSSGSGWSGNSLKTSPGTGTMSTGGGEKFRAPN